MLKNNIINKRRKYGNNINIKILNGKIKRNNKANKIRI